VCKFAHRIADDPRLRCVRRSIDGVSIDTPIADDPRLRCVRRPITPNRVGNGIADDPRLRCVRRVSLFWVSQALQDERGGFERFDDLVQIAASCRRLQGDPCQCLLGVPDCLECIGSDCMNVTRSVDRPG